MLDEAQPHEPKSETVWFFKSKRFWSAVSAAGGALSTVFPSVVAISPVAGAVCRIAGIVCVVAGSVGLAWFIPHSSRTIQYLPGNGKPPAPPLAPQP